MAKKFIFERYQYLENEKKKEKEERRLMKFIRDHFKKFGGNSREYCVGICLKDRYDERMKEHENNYEIIKKTKNNISSNYTDVIRNVEGYFTVIAKTKNPSEWTYGGPGGDDLPYYYLYIFKFSDLKGQKQEKENSDDKS